MHRLVQNYGRLCLGDAPKLTYLRQLTSYADHDRSTTPQFRRVPRFREALFKQPQRPRWFDETFLSTKSFDPWKDLFCSRLDLQRISPATFNALCARARAMGEESLYLPACGIWIGLSHSTVVRQYLQLAITMISERPSNKREVRPILHRFVSRRTRHKSPGLRRDNQKSVIDTIDAFDKSADSVHTVCRLSKDAEVWRSYFRLLNMWKGHDAVRTEWSSWDLRNDHQATKTAFNQVVLELTIAGKHTAAWKIADKGLNEGLQLENPVWQVLLSRPIGTRNWSSLMEKPSLDLLERMACDIEDILGIAWKNDRHVVLGHVQSDVAPLSVSIDGA